MDAFRQRAHRCGAAFDEVPAKFRPFTSSKTVKINFGVDGAYARNDRVSLFIILGVAPECRDASQVVEIGRDRAMNVTVALAIGFDDAQVDRLGFFEPPLCQIEESQVPQRGDSPVVGLAQSGTADIIRAGRARKDFAESLKFIFGQIFPQIPFLKMIKIFTGGWEYENKLYRNIVITIYIETQEKISILVFKYLKLLITSLILQLTW